MSSGDLLCCQVYNFHLGQKEEGQKSSNDKELIGLPTATAAPIALQYLAEKIAGTLPAVRMQKAAGKD